MSAREEADFALEAAFGIEPHETVAFLDAYRDGVLREAAEKIRESIGPGPLPHETVRTTRYVQGHRDAADLIDPDAT